jgi:hypothetical protein
MMPPSTQPVTVVLCSFKQQQSSKQWQVVTSGQLNGQLSHQLKHGLNLQQQFSQCGSFSWQQPSQSVQVLQPLEQLWQLPPDEHEHDGAALALASHAGAVLLQRPLSDAVADAAVTGGVCDAAG